MAIHLENVLSPMDGDMPLPVFPIDAVERRFGICFHCLAVLGVSISLWLYLLLLRRFSTFGHVAILSVMMVSNDENRQAAGVLLLLNQGNGGSSKGLPNLFCLAGFGKEGSKRCLA